MLDFIINLLISAGVLLLMSYILPTVTVKSFGTAVWVAFLIGILNALVSLLLWLPLNLATFFLLGFIVRLIITTIAIKLADKLVSNFEVKGWWPALLIAIALSAAATLADRTNSDDDNHRIEQHD